MPSIIITNLYTENVKFILYELAPAQFNLVFLAEAEPHNRAGLLAEADYLLAGGKEKIDETLLALAPKLRLIQRSGVGLDSIDLQALQKRKIHLYRTAGINAQSVAEHTLMLLLATLRKAVFADKQIRQGIWSKQALGITTRELHGKKVGLIGMGAIAQIFASLLQPFRTEINYFDPRRLPLDEENRKNLTYRNLDDLLATSDVVSLHCELTPQTEYMIAERELAIMKPGSVLINTARGELVKESALVASIQSGHIAGAGLDVFETEPLSDDSPLRGMDQVLLTPHIAGVTRDSFEAMMRNAFQNIATFHAGNTAALESQRVV